jgi:hypothetical protein
MEYKEPYMEEKDELSGKNSSRFKPGHKGGPGRPRKRTFTLQVRELCHSTGINPVQIALDLVATGKLPGTAERATMAQRLKALDAILPFCTPKLSSNTSVAAVHVEQQASTLDITELMKNPQLARAAQTLAAGLIEAEAAQIDAERARNDQQPKAFDWRSEIPEDE